METIKSRIKNALVTIHETAKAEEGLDLAAPWRLKDNEVVRLNDRGGHVPPAGWMKLVQLAAGTNLLEVSREEFAANEDPEILEVDDPRPELLRTFYDHLVPPGAAAGLFLAAKIHPAWGIKIAERSHGNEGFDDPVAGKVAEAIQDCIFSILEILETTQSVSISETKELVQTYTQRIREETSEVVNEEPEPPVFIDIKTNKANRQFARDLVESVLVPAGIATFNGAKYEFNGDVIAEITR